MRTFNYIALWVLLILDFKPAWAQFNFEFTIDYGDFSYDALELPVVTYLPLEMTPESFDAIRKIKFFKTGEESHSRLYSIGNDGVMAKWDIENARVVWKTQTGIMPHDFAFYSSANFDWIVVTGSQGRILVLGINGNLIPSPLDKRVNIDITSVAFSQGAFADQTMVAFGSAQGKVYVCDFPGGAKCQSIRVSGLPIFSLKFYQNDFLLIASDNINLHRLNLFTGLYDGKLELFSGSTKTFDLKSVASIPDASVLLVASRQDIFAYNVVEDSLMGRMQTPEFSDNIHAIQYRPNLGKILTISSSQELMLWDVFEGQVVEARKLLIPSLALAANSKVAIDPQHRYIAFSVHSFGLDLQFSAKLAVIKIPASELLPIH